MAIFNEMAITHWEKLEGLCRESTIKEIMTWRIRNNIFIVLFYNE